jgi:uncharacterized protein (TIRG00374 family)
MSGNAPRERNSSGWIFRWIGPLLFVGLWWLSDLGQARDVVGRTRFWPLLVAVLLNVAIIFVKSWRWREIMKSQAIDYPYLSAVRSYSIASALAAWTPGRIGDFSKAISVSREREVSFGSAASSVIADRLLDALLLTLVAAAGGALLLGTVARTVTWCLVALALVIGYVLTRWAGTTTARRTREALGRVGLGGAGHQVEDALTGLGQMARPSGRRTLFTAIPATLVATSFTFLQGYMVAWSLHLDVSFIRLSAGLGAASIASLLPLSVSGIGLREATMAVFLGPAGIVLAEVLTFSMTFLIVVNGSVALMGALTHALWPRPAARPSSGMAGRPGREGCNA